MSCVLGPNKVFCGTPSFCCLPRCRLRTYKLRFSSAECPTARVAGRALLKFSLYTRQTDANNIHKAESSTAHILQEMPHSTSQITLTNGKKQRVSGFEALSRLDVDKTLKTLAKLTNKDATLEQQIASLSDLQKEMDRICSDDLSIHVPKLEAKDALKPSVLKYVSDEVKQQLIGTLKSHPREALAELYLEVALELLKREEATDVHVDGEVLISTSAQRLLLAAISEACPNILYYGEPSVLDKLFRQKDVSKLEASDTPLSNLLMCLVNQQNDANYIGAYYKRMLPTILGNMKSKPSRLSLFGKADELESDIGDWGAISTSLAIKTLANLKEKHEVVHISSETYAKLRKLVSPWPPATSSSSPSYPLLQALRSIYQGSQWAALYPQKKKIVFEKSADKLFETWFNEAARTKNLSDDVCIDLLHLMARPENSPVFLKWTSLASDSEENIALTGKLIGTLDQARKASCGKEVSDLGRLWKLMDRRLLKHTLQGFHHAHALLLDEMKRQTRAKDAAAKDLTTIRRKTIEAVDAKIAKLTHHLGNRSIVTRLFGWMYNLIRLVMFLMLGSSLITRLFPSLASPQVLDHLAACNGLIGKGYCTTSQGISSAGQWSKGKIWQPHVAPKVDPAVNHIWRRVEPHVPVVQEAMKPIAAAAGSALLSGMAWAEDTAGRTVDWAANRDWNKVADKGWHGLKRVGSFTADVGKRGVDKVTPHAAGYLERLGNSVTDKLASMDNASPLFKSVHGTVSSIADVVTKQLKVGGMLWLNGVKASYIFATGRRPSFPGETWQTRLAEVSVWEDFLNVVDATLVRAVRGLQRVSDAAYRFGVWCLEQLGFHVPDELETPAGNAHWFTEKQPARSASSDDLREMFRDLGYGEEKIKWTGADHYHLDDAVLEEEDSTDSPAEKSPFVKDSPGADSEPLEIPEDLQEELREIERKATSETEPFPTQHVTFETEPAFESLSDDESDAADDFTPVELEISEPSKIVDESIPTPEPLEKPPSTAREIEIPTSQDDTQTETLIVPSPLAPEKEAVESESLPTSSLDDLPTETVLESQETDEVEHVMPQVINLPYEEPPREIDNDNAKCDAPFEPAEYVELYESELDMEPELEEDVDRD